VLWPVPVPPPLLSFEDLRSTWATTAYETTGDVRFVQAGLGHSDPRLNEQRFAAARRARCWSRRTRSASGPAGFSPGSYSERSPETPNPPLLSESTGSMNLSTCDQRACPDSNRGPLASEANGRTFSVPLAAGGS
jgi:hypothetical protein